MSRKFVIQSVLGVMALAVAGCAGTTGSGGGVETRAYIAQKDRVDQKMEGGNFGYVNGTPKQPDLSKMSKSRKVYVLEFTKNPDVTPDDLRKGVPPAQPVTINVPERRPAKDVQPSQPPIVPIVETPAASPTSEVAPAANSSSVPSEYVIQKGDTLQKISMKIFGTTKKWYKIHEINKDILPDANRIKPGLTIRIPQL